MQLLNMNIRKKLFASFTALTLFLILASIFGYAGIKKISGMMDTMFEEHYVISVTLNGLKAEMNRARTLLLTMMNEKDKEKLDAIKKRLDDEVRPTINDGFSKLMESRTDDKMKASFKELQDTWDVFRETRDKQIIPLIYAGKVGEAAALGLGVQKERYDKIMNMISSIIKHETDEAEAAQKEAHSGAQRAAVTLIVISILGLVLSVIIAVTISGNLAKRIQVIAGVSEAIAKGDLTKEVNVSGGDEIGGMAVSFKEMQKNLMGIVSQVREASSQVAIASDQIAQGNQDFSQRITEQSASVEETASTMEEMASAVRQNADSAREANKLAAEARNSAEEGGNVMGNMIMAMGEINSSSKKISEIIDVIDEIAFQTNILALNAAVEAARAGDQGRGFAVVAVEVRNLAQRSAQAAKEISTLIKDSVEKVEDGQKLANASKTTLDGIINHVKRVADLIGEMSAASQEQADGVEQVNKAMTQMDQVTQQNASLAEEASATAEEMSAEAKQLLELVGFFKTSEHGREETGGSLHLQKGHGHGGNGKKKVAGATAKGNGHDKEVHAHGADKGKGEGMTKYEGKEEGFEEF